MSDLNERIKTNNWNGYGQQLLEQIRRDRIDERKNGTFRLNTGQ